MTFREKQQAKRGIALWVISVLVLTALTLWSLRAEPAEQKFGGSPQEMTAWLIAEGRLPKEPPQSGFYRPPVPGESVAEMVDRWMKAWCNDHSDHYWAEPQKECVEVQSGPGN